MVDLIKDTIDVDDLELQLVLIISLSDHYQNKAVADWVQYYRIPEEELPDHVKYILSPEKQ